MAMRILVLQTRAGWTAYFRNFPDKKATGLSDSEALANLIRAYQGELGLSVEILKNSLPVVHR